jgi:hypothetical protein
VTSGALDDYLTALRGAERVTARCAFCTFEIRAPLEQARQAFAEHECGPAEASQDLCTTLARAAYRARS